MLEKNYDSAAVEPRIAKAWEDADAFRAGEGAKPGAETFTIVIPPPNVTGSLHMGHALNNTLQDIMVRFERMRGKDVLWQPGMDHAGIATQMVVERKLAAEKLPGRREMGREAFVEKVWEWKAESGGLIFNQLKRLGASCDWSRERFTMDEGLSDAVLEVFVSLYKEGLIYRGKRLVNWDPKFETAISDLEVENKEVDGHMWHFKYPLAGGETYTYVEKDADGNVVFQEERDYISIATTRPETMLGDGAVAVHPSDERYAPIVGKLCEIPVGPKAHRRLIPIITDEYPEPDFGSGAVKITGAHDFNDYQVARRNNIPLYRLMDTRAALRADGEPYAFYAAQALDIAKTGHVPNEAEVDDINLVPDEYRGLDRYEARKRIVDAINAEGLAVTVKDAEGNDVPFVENKKVMQPFGDRSGVVIEPMLTDQWFADAATLAKPAIASVREGRTNFVPKNWEKTYFDWMENIEPWCISRQLWWGHQIPAWYGPDGQVFVEKTEEEALHAAIQHYIAHEGPWKAWVEEKLENFAPGDILTRDEDVLDTWFSSALWPFSTLGWPEQTPELAKYYQTDVLVTGFDIIFFWVARMMMMGLHLMKDEYGNPIEPFHTVYVHALVRDKNGQKMSKSKGNVIDPLELIDEYGADALRFTLAIMAAQGRDVKLDPARIAGYRNFGTKLWNATRFAEMNGVASDPKFVPEAASLTINRWILTELARTARDVTEAIETYRFNDAASTLYRFVWNQFCDWYLELLKPVFSGEDAAAKAESQACAAYVLEEIYKLLHPFMPFMTEELWAHTAGEGKTRDTLVCHAEWPSPAYGDEAAADEINWLIDLVSGIRSVRAEMNVPPSATAPLVMVDANAMTKKRLETHDSAIRRLARVEQIRLEDTAPKGAAQIVVGEATACLPLGTLIDLAAEKARLEKAIEKAKAEATRIQAKLSNEKFVANAKPDVVEAERERFAELEQQLASLAVALARVSEAG
ncbi:MULTISPECIES: valine--tRNA ligase [unclassified Shinella]|jgi:valyl-tRNA synthetase|uniref:valine--tRNA ligase n=1 Tax=unclassified Shinella TaxID=2643062 RepID=UPI0003C540B6|nr:MULTISPECIES: valine--tRNA ligase [unclassified Shinella]EYR82393.1 valine--tRNA ligase ValS [Shinella sp. DD12]KNY16770.1 valine--tRNA ligase [Shinella sp. SUS2]KOC73248.1 valine--tRNA ligase [Shinella sp. GWS1]MCO5152621.1 valine--tRNA ligase [Shinella sp.]MDC7261916.1 valine--tRNA ligase [Shinella sp. HY16]